MKNHAPCCHSCVVRIVAIVAFVTNLLPPGAATAAPIVSEPFQIAATAWKEFGFCAAFDGTNFLVGILGNATSSAAITAQLVSQAGTPVGGRIDTGRTGDIGRVAFDGTNYLMGWKDTAGGLYGQFVATNGSLLDAPFEIAASPVYDLQAFGFGGGVYLAAYAKARRERLYGRIIQPNGTVGGEFQISTGDVNGAYGLAFDGTSFFIPWTDQSDGTTVKGRFVAPTGNLSSEFIIDDSSPAKDNPGAVGFDGTNYLVVWMGDISEYNWDLFGRLVTPAGTFPSPSFPISEAPGTQFLPTVVGGGGRWLLAWVDMSRDEDNDFQCDSGEGTCWDLHGRFFDPDGTPHDGPFVITDAPHSQLGGAVAYAADKALCITNEFGDVIDFNLPFWAASNDVFGVFVSEDASPTPVVSIVAVDPVAAEPGPDTGAFTVSRTGETTADLTVSYSLTGTATLGADYVVTPAPVLSLTIPAGAASATITVTPVNDIAPEPSETVVATLGAGTGYSPGIPGSASVSIASNDPTVSLPTALDLKGAWKTGGAARWYGQKSATHDRKDAASPDVLWHGQSSWLQFTAQGPATVSFWWRTSSETGDKLKFSIDRRLKAVRSGRGGWQQKSFPIGAGRHVLQWEFRRNASGSAGLNTGHVDQVTITR